MPTEQSAAHHASRDPLFLALALVAIVNLILAITYTIHQWPIHSRSHLWWIVMSVFFLLHLGQTRRYATKNQDRIIRLEERVRYAALLPPAQAAAAAHSLTLQQVIALRFASDAELPGLIQRTLTENLDPKSIKQAILTWRPDHQRV